MAIKIGDVDVAKEIVELNFQLIRTQLILEFLINNNAAMTRPDQNALKQIEDRALKVIQSKFPTMGVQKK